jgi:hypothetical protein
MLSSVLRSARAVQVNVEIMRAFVRLRSMLGENAELPIEDGAAISKPISRCYVESKPPNWIERDRVTFPSTARLLR